MSRKTLLIGVASVATVGLGLVGYAQIASAMEAIKPEPDDEALDAAAKERAAKRRADAQAAEAKRAADKAAATKSAADKAAAKQAADKAAAARKAADKAAAANVVKTIPEHAVRVTNTDQPKPAEPKRRTAKAAAEQLYTLATAAIRNGKPETLGTLAHPNAQIREMQKDMRGIEADGVYYKKTQARGKELLGKPFPTRPESSLHEPSVRALPPPAEHVTVKPAAKPAARARPAAKPTPAKPAAKPTPTAAQPADATTPAGVALALDKYIAVQGGRARSVIADAQWMLELDTDGIPAKLTRGRVERLLARSVDWPADIEHMVSGAAPGGSSPREAADRLVRYVREFNGARPERIKAYQIAMGVDPAGVVGPKTKARVLGLNGVQL